MVVLCQLVKVLYLQLSQARCGRLCRLAEAMAVTLHVVLACDSSVVPRITHLRPVDANCEPPGANLKSTSGLRPHVRGAVQGIADSTKAESLRERWFVHAEVARAYERLQFLRIRTQGTIWLISMQV